MKFYVQNLNHLYTGFLGERHSVHLKSYYIWTSEKTNVQMVLSISLYQKVNGGSVEQQNQKIILWR